MKMFVLYSFQIKALVGMTDDNKRHYRTKTRDILARFVRWYGADTILQLVPQSEKVMCMRLRNMRKIQERKKRQRQAELEAKKSKEDDDNDDIQFSVKAKPKRYLIHCVSVCFNKKIINE